jgi:hypothetical protein
MFILDVTFNKTPFASRRDGHRLYIITKTTSRTVPGHPERLPNGITTAASLFVMNGSVIRT